jgi:membrane protein
MTAPTTRATPKIALDQRATSRHDNALQGPSQFRLRGLPAGALCRHWLKGNNARSFGIYLWRPVCCAPKPTLIQGERNRKMAEHRRIWPLLVYGGLAAIAAARRGVIERTRASWDHVAARHPYRTTYPAPDETSEVRGDSHPATQADLDKRPREQFENDQPISAQLHRAKEQGRGRHAVAPWQIPWAGWKDILWRVYASVNDNRLLAVAAGVVFYSLLAIFPAIAAFVSLYGLIADASTIDSHLSLAAGVFPAGAVDILHEQITRLTTKSDAKLGLGFITGLAIALWSANAGMKAIIDALNVVYDEKEKRSFVKLNLLSLLFTLVAIVSLMIALAAVVIAPIIFSVIGLSSFFSLAIVVLRWPLLLVLAAVALAAIYRYGPSRTEARWQWLSVGSAAAALGWLITSVLFSWYIAHFGAYNATYGSLGAAVGMMMWMWISAIVILLGGELNAEIEHQTARDSTVGSEKPLGRRGAVMADTIGAARSQ